MRCANMIGGWASLGKSERVVGQNLTKGCHDVVCFMFFFMKRTAKIGSCLFWVFRHQQTRKLKPL